MPKIRKKKVIDANVYEKAIERLNHIFDRFDTVAVSFSGGKDSTVCLNLALQVAREKGKLPLEVMFFDEEAIHPETIEYVERVRQNPDVRMRWYCLPIKHRNACSRKEPYWYPWAIEDKDKWIRPLPENVITEDMCPWFKRGDSIPDIYHLLYGREYGSVAQIVGLRADESLRRFRAVAMKKEYNYIATPVGNAYLVKPIYDWTTFDVWTAPQIFGWDYNRAYDVMALAGVHPDAQRVCPPYGEEPLGGLWMYKVCWQEMWDKMVNRVHGANTAGMYANTELYGFGHLKKPEGMTWQSWMFSLIELYPKEYKPIVAGSIHQIIEGHKKKTKRPIHEEQADEVTGISWKKLAMIANRGDLKGRRKGNFGGGSTEFDADDGETRF